MVSLARARGTGHKLEHKRVPLNTRQNFCAVLVLEPWHRMPREVLGAPPWRSSKKHLDMVLCKQLWVSLFDQGLHQVDPEVPSIPSHSDSMIL